jgi:hypothetical protein
MNIDGVRTKPSTTPKQNDRTRPALPGTPIRVKHLYATKPIRLFNNLDKKQTVTIIVTFLVTFIFSIATSQSLASHENIKIAEVTPTTTTTSFAVTTKPQILTLDDQVLSQPGEVFLPKEKISLPDPLKKRKEFLEKYLKAKNSPLADHVAAISEQSQWKLIIGISRAESSFCKHQVTNNCWGIGGAWNMKGYKNFDQAVTDVNRILEDHYIQAGLTTPKKIVKKYVGHQNDDWQATVEQELKNLSQVD